MWTDNTPTLALLIVIVLVWVSQIKKCLLKNSKHFETTEKKRFFSEI